MWAEKSVKSNVELVKLPHRDKSEREFLELLRPKLGG